MVGLSFVEIVSVVELDVHDGKVVYKCSLPSSDFLMVVTFFTRPRGLLQNFVM